MMRWLGRTTEFPDPETADADGVVAVGGDCTVERLLRAYRGGIFPWPLSPQMPLFWFSPDPRYVIEPKAAHVGRSIRKQMRRGVFEVRADTDFAGVIDGCAETPRPGQDGTWITPELRDGFLALHRRGFAHSIEAWHEGELVGGLYGMSLGGVFFGESMFARAPDASKVAFATLLAHLLRWNFDFVDCQTRTEHLLRFGSVPWSRRQFLSALQRSLEAPTRQGAWSLELSPAEAADVVPG